MLTEIQSSLNSFSHELWKAVLQVGTQAASGETAVAPHCKCQKAAKLVISKSANNPNRPFYTCNQGNRGKNKKKGGNKAWAQRRKSGGGPKKEGCDYFQWVDQLTKKNNSSGIE